MMSLEDQILDVLTDPPDGIVVLPDANTNSYRPCPVTMNEIDRWYEAGELLELFNVNYTFARGHADTNYGAIGDHRSGMAMIMWDENPQQQSMSTYHSNMEWGAKQLSHYGVEWDPDITF